MLVTDWIDERARNGLQPWKARYGQAGHRHRHKSLAYAPFVARLTLKQTLAGHHGCVNSIRWNKNKTLLLSGSDDRNVVLWQVGHQKSKIVQEIHTLHRHNIFDAQMNDNNTHIVTCGADGIVTVLNIPDASMAPISSQVYFGQHSIVPPCRFMANRLTWRDNNVFVCTFGDGSVRQFDIREPPDSENDVHSSILVKYDTSARPIENCPFDANILAVGCDDPFVRMIDIRHPKTAVAKFSYSKFADDSHSKSNSSNPFTTHFGLEKDVSISCLDWGPRGEILVNYRSDNIVTFDGMGALRAGYNGCHEYMKRVYTGRENVQTIAKEARYLFEGQFFASGGDCGGMFLWDVAQSEPVTRFHADRCCVNCILPHTEMNYVLSSGIDNDIKFWDMGTQTRPLAKITETSKPVGSFSERMQEDGSLKSLTEENAVKALEQSETLKKAGNDLIKEKNYKVALEKYIAGMSAANFICQSNDEIEAQKLVAQGLIGTNVALCYYNLQEYKNAIQACDKVLAINDKNQKATYRKAQSYFALGNYDTTIELLKSMEIKDVAVTQLLRDAEKKIRAEKENERKRCKRMFEA